MLFVACAVLLAFIILAVDIDFFPYQLIRRFLELIFSLPEVCFCTPPILWLLGLRRPATVLDKSVVVTGAASGIGRALAERLAELGWSVLACDINMDLLLELEGKHNLSCHHLDVTCAKSCKALAGEVARRFPEGLSALANIAGIVRPAPLIDCSDEDINLSLAINIAGPLRMMRLLMPSLLQGSAGGTVLNMSSTNGLDSWPWSGAYPTTKHALEGASNSVRREALANGLPLKVVLVEPGPVNTPLSKHMPLNALKWCNDHKDSVWTPAMRKNAETSSAAMIKFGRIPFRVGYEAWEVAEVCALALSDKRPRARYVCVRGPFLWLWWAARLLPEEIGDAIMSRV